jgi:precorrin-2 dehydrogenase/sirohydrochlorin ferrochelatase
MSPFGYPLFLELAGQRCVVIGEDAVRDGKVKGLLAGGADDVLVLALGPEARLAELQGVGGVEIQRRRWRASDLDGAFLVVASSRDSAEREAIAHQARTRHVLVNVMDDVPNCDWAAPAVVRRGHLVVAVGTGGASPALARKVREDLQQRYGPEWAEVVEVLRRVREETLPSLPSFMERARRWRGALDPDEAARLVREGKSEELEARLRSRLLEVPV